MTMDVSQHSSLIDLFCQHSYTSTISDTPPPVAHVYTTYTTNATNKKCDGEMDDLSSSREQNMFPEEISTGAVATDFRETSASFPEEISTGVVATEFLETNASSRMSALMIMSSRSSRSSASGASYCEESRNRNITDASLDISGRKKSSFNNRAALLEQTAKNRSWSNLSGYNSCTGPRSLRQDRTNHNSGLVTNADRLSHSTNPVLRSLYSSSTDRSLGHGPGIPVSHFSSTDDPYDQYSQYARRNKRTYATTNPIERGTLQLQSANGETSRPVNMHGSVTEPTSFSLDLENLNTIKGKSILVAPSRRDTKVAFSTVEVRQYERILGDNPGVSSGPPLSIGWNYYEDSTICLPVDEFEYYHGSCGDQSEMVLTRFERESILRDLGYSERDLATCIRQNYKLKKNRRQTVNNLSIMPVEVAVESAKKSFSRMIMFPKRKERNSSMRLYREWKNNKNGDFNDAASFVSEVGSERRSILKSAASSQTMDDTCTQASQGHDLLSNVDHPPSGASVQSLEHKEKN